MHKNNRGDVISFEDIAAVANDDKIVMTYCIVIPSPFQGQGQISVSVAHAAHLRTDELRM